MILRRLLSRTPAQPKVHTTPPPAAPVSPPWAPVRLDWGEPTATVEVVLTLERTVRRGKRLRIVGEVPLHPQYGVKQPDGSVRYAPPHFGPVQARVVEE